MATEEFTGEEWRAIYGWPYEVSSLGRVRRRERAVSRRVGTFLGGSVSRGYLDVVLCRDGTTARHRVHHLVAAAFVGPRPAGLQINHIDGDKFNNRASNLEWVTGAANIQHAYRTGLAHARKGSAHPCAILTEAVIPRMRLEYSQGLRVRDIAAKYGCSEKNAWHIVRGATWRHVKTPDPIHPSPASVGTRHDK